MMATPETCPFCDFTPVPGPKAHGSINRHIKLNAKPGKKFRGTHPELGSELYIEVARQRNFRSRVREGEKRRRLAETKKHCEEIRKKCRDGKRRCRAGLGPGQSWAGLNWTLRPARDRLLKSPRPARPSPARPGISVARPDFGPIIL